MLYISYNLHRSAISATIGFTLSISAPTPRGIFGLVRVGAGFHKWDADRRQSSPSVIFDARVFEIVMIFRAQYVLRFASHSGIIRRIMTKKNRGNDAFSKRIVTNEFGILIYKIKVILKNRKNCLFSGLIHINTHYYFRCKTC